MYLDRILLERYTINTDSFIELSNVSKPVRMKFKVASRFAQTDQIQMSAGSCSAPCGMDAGIIGPRQIEKGISEIVSANLVAVMTVGAAMDTAGNSVIGQ